MSVEKSPLLHPYPPCKLRFQLLKAMVRFMPTGWKYWGNGILLTTSVADGAPFSVPEPFVWKWAGSDEIDYLDRHPEATSPTAYARRAARGDRCLCIKHGSVVVGYQWVTRRNACVLCGFDPRMEIILFPLAPDQAFSYDVFAYRKYRGRGIGTLLKKLLFHAMRDEGVKEVLAIVAPDNHPSLRLQLRLGAQPVRMVYSYRIRDWSRTFLGPENDARLGEWVRQFMPHSAAARAT